MSTTNPFSVNNTRIRRLTVNGESLVEKTITRNAPLPVALDDLKAEMDAYRGQLTAAGVPMPRIADSRVTDSSIVYLCEDGGQNLVERYERPELLTNGHTDVLTSAIGILKRAIDAGLAIDPHIKNFVGGDAGLTYVDFSPPLTETYVEARCSVARDTERDILRENFAYFTPYFLPYHFAGDFLNVDRSADSLFPALHALLTDAGLLSSVPLEEFVSRASAIRALEDRRLQEQIYLI
ncbi:MAG: hypothetical protein OXL97_04495 [Chloroflexota bacterium]|nr:hypothetical protein [Chloroflexota bacterium]MDE2884191.1 hypothetical protein [Chloroflexota bacterium]